MAGVRGGLGGGVCRYGEGAGGEEGDFAGCAGVVVVGAGDER